MRCVMCCFVLTPACCVTVEQPKPRKRKREGVKLTPDKRNSGGCISQHETTRMCVTPFEGKLKQMLDCITLTFVFHLSLVFPSGVLPVCGPP